MERESREELERWAAALARSEVAELRAAGRAITTLCAENEELARRLTKLERSDPGDGDASPPPRRSTGSRQKAKRTLPWRRAVLVAGVAALGVSGAAVAARATGPELVTTGPEQDALIGSAALSALSFSAAGEGTEWLLDGRRIRAQTRGAQAVFRPERLADGPHELIVSRRGRFFTSAERTFRFTVDTTAPTLDVPGPAVVNAGQPLALRGRIEPGARLEHGSTAIPLDEQGAFELRASPAPRRIELLATDAAGNASRWRVPVTVVPRRPEQPIRSVHVTAYAWADEGLRGGVLALVRANKINAVELDLKDESGEIGWASGVPLARRMGAQLEIYDLAEAVEELHGLGVRVIGRLVCFRDPIHARAAWDAGRRNEVVQSSAGGPYAGYGGFTNFADPAVRRYNVDLAVAAAKLGVDEILFDYVRRPDGPIDSMRFPGLNGKPERVIVRFLAETREALAGTDTLVGASVFGVAATRPEEVAQDIPAMARQVDYIAPMLYPSHWGPGEYGVADPNGQPYDIVRLSTEDFVEHVRGTGARVVNWIQDFSYGRDYGAEEVRAQIRASRNAGVDEFILWDAAVTYTDGALDPTAKLPALDLTTTPPKDAPMPVRLADPKRQPTRSAIARGPAVQRPLPGLPANELGQIPVVMHHQIRRDRVGEYDQTPKEFRAELELLWKRGYVPVAVSDLLDGRIDIPAGTSPVVMTFDDATKEQLALRADGSPKPETAVGIMLDFARSHPGFEPAGTFYVNREPFGSAEAGRELLAWLVEHGFELGNHTHDHTPLGGLSATEVQRELIRGAGVIHAALPGYRIRSLSLPMGSMPNEEQLAVRGSWNGSSYGPYGVLLVGASPAASPYSTAFDPGAIPRIRTSHAGWKGQADFGFSYWMTELQRNPRARYVSDGDPDTIGVRAGELSRVKTRFRSRVAP